MAEIALVENIQRHDLNAIEEAEGIKRLMNEFGFNQEQAAKKNRPQPYSGYQYFKAFEFTGSCA